jgi:hypothetical protein
MQSEHPDIVERAYLVAGFTRDQSGHWVDGRRLDPANAVRIAARRFPPERAGVLHRSAEP